MTSATTKQQHRSPDSRSAVQDRRTAPFYLCPTKGNGVFSSLHSAVLWHAARPYRKPSAYQPPEPKPRLRQVLESRGYEVKRPPQGLKWRTAHCLECDHPGKTFGYSLRLQKITCFAPEHLDGRVLTTDEYVEHLQELGLLPEDEEHEPVPETVKAHRNDDYWRAEFTQLREFSSKPPVRCQNCGTLRSEPLPDCDLAWLRSNPLPSCGKCGSEDLQEMGWQELKQTYLSEVLGRVTKREKTHPLVPRLQVPLLSPTNQSIISGPRIPCVHKHPCITRWPSDAYEAAPPTDLEAAGSIPDARQAEPGSTLKVWDAGRFGRKSATTVELRGDPERCVHGRVTSDHDPTADEAIRNIEGPPDSAVRLDRLARLIADGAPVWSRAAKDREMIKAVLSVPERAPMPIDPLPVVRLAAPTVTRPIDCLFNTPFDCLFWEH